MANQLEGLPEARRWNLLVGAAKAAAEAHGFKLTRIPGRGLSNIWLAEKDGVPLVASIRTTRDRWLAFPPLEGGTKWKTLDDVDLVIVASVDNKDAPKNIEVYVLSADDVRQRFNAAYAARKKAGHTQKDNFGMWVGLDVDQRKIAASVGSGLVEKHKPIAVYSIEALLGDLGYAAPEDQEPGEESVPAPRTIAEVMDWAREQVAQIAGVRIESVKLDLKLEY
jgi:hypothetical protein